MRLMNRKSVTISLALSAALIVSSSPGITGAVPKSHNNSKSVITLTPLNPARQESRKNDKMDEVEIDKEGSLLVELQEKYERAFNLILEQCSDWQPSLESPKSIDTVCKDLAQKMRVAGTKMTAQSELMFKHRKEASLATGEFQPPRVPARPHRKRVAVPMDAATLKKNQVRIEKEIKLRDFFQGVQDNALGRLLGNCGESIHRNPAIPKSSDAVCEQLGEKMKIVGNIMLEQGDLVSRLMDELPVAARKDNTPQCDGFYLPSGTFITLPDCPPSEVPES